MLAEAAQRADASTEGGTAATRAYAVAAATAAVNAEKEASALREQAQVLGLVERQLGTAGAAQRRTVAVSGEARAGYQQLSFQLGDVATQYAAGTSASIIFAQQSGQVIQAISMISGESKGLIGLLGGPWGIAFTAGLVALTPWVAKLLEGNDALGDAIEKLKKDASEAELARQAHDAFTRTLEGQIEAQRKLNEEMERGLQSQRQINQNNLQTSLDNQAKRLQDLTKAERELANARTAAAKAQERVLKPSALDTPEGAQANVVAAQVAEDRVRAAEAKVANLKRSVSEAQQGVRDARITIANDEAKAAVDPIAAINLQYDKMADAARAAARGNDELTASIGKTLAGIERQRTSAFKSEQDRQAAERRSETDVRNGRVTPTEVGEMLQRRFGGSYSGSRSAARNAKVGGVANSRHLRDQAVDFVPAGGMGAVSKDEIRAYLAEQGIRIEELLGPGDKKHDNHFHVGFSKTRRNSEQIARSQQSAENTQTRNQDEYASLLSRVQNDRLNIEQRRLVTISDIAANERQQVDLAQADIVRAAEKGVALGKWSQELADAVKLQAQQNADAEKAAITEKEQIALRQQAMDAELAQLDGQAELLQLQGQLAGTTKERRRIALELLEIESRQARVALERQLAGEQDPSRRAMLADELSRQDRNTAIKRQLVEQQNASPMDRYRQELADFDFDDELQSAQVRFFENMNDELAESATRFIKLKGVAGDFFNQMIADMIRLQIKQAMLGGGSGGILGSVLRFAGVAFGNPLSSSLTTASNNVAALESQIDYQNLRGFSSGGWTGNIGRKSIAGFVHGNEFVFDADATARIGVDTLEALRAGRLTSAAAASVPSVLSAERAAAAQPGIVRVEVASNEMFQAIVTQISGNVAAQVAASSAPAIVGLATGKATSTMSQRARRQLR
ncbi:D-Ala-D-Ala carboxypeptidase family metallohydrolase [Sphingobium sp. S6]|uniref:D-Ala-D-Ala carboxypeptidase family metallohydrolase n=1 Tax=Sphingobium sp. S6 TaxID=2758386 RepID=UPI00191A3E61|nr:D-Ala-D-Ala carboxypeptidase family metallohydrolase [Sphingobium sp. S6]